MIAIVEQDGSFVHVIRFISEVINVVRQHLNQPLVIRHVGFCAMGKEGESQAIHGQMSLDPIRQFVETKPF